MNGYLSHLLLFNFNQFSLTEILLHGLHNSINLHLWMLCKNVYQGH